MRIVVVGAGPAGLAAAECAGTATLIDDNNAAGGQIWRASETLAVPPGIDVKLNTRVVSATSNELLLETNGGPERLPYDRLILATGARELFLPFPGWTLPGVFGAGGLQALAKSGLSLNGKRVVVAGSGPLLLAVAHYLKEHGASVHFIAEQASWANLLTFATALPPSKWLEAIKLYPPRFSPSSWITEAAGKHYLESVTIHTPAGHREIACDYLACGFGLIPNDELPHLLGVDPASVDDYQRTMNSSIYCAGEVTGVGGVDLSILEGRIAGYAAADRLDEARALFPRRAKWARFLRSLQRAFAPGSELRELPKPDTIVCRCEDVTYAQLTGKQSWTEAKLHTRCGMGPCQGRVCGPAVEFLFGWRPAAVRPPIFPTNVGSLITMGDTSK